MGMTQSSDIKREVADLAPTSSSEAGNIESDDDNKNWMPITGTDEELDEESSDDDDDEEEDEEVEERLRILKETRKLKTLAEYFLHPEKPVRVEPAACGRCYFDRFSASQPLSEEESEEAAKILAEMKLLKKLALDYKHPELPVETSDATACARCYFDRASAPSQEDEEEDAERELILKEMEQLREAASAYLHPEAPLEADPTVCGRNYFMRPSTPMQLTEEEEAERQLILKDARNLAKLARAVRGDGHIASDPTFFGRNYFTRPSAPEQTSMEEETERSLILADAKALCKLARDYLHPELPVTTTDPTVFGRNYFTRPSAPKQTPEEKEQRQLVLEDAKALQTLAVNFLHPELPVATVPTAFGRNYFSRPSATPQTNFEDDLEEELVMIEAGRLEQQARDYLHPELPVRPRDPAAEGRNLLALAAAPDSGNIHVFSDDYWHHAHFDMEDHIHLHHVDFDMNKAHHDEISQVKLTSPKATRKVIRDFDEPIPGSPGCVMTFAQPETHNLPQYWLPF